MIIIRIRIMKDNNKNNKNLKKIKIFNKQNYGQLY